MTKEHRLTHGTYQREFDEDGKIKKEVFSLGEAQVIRDYAYENGSAIISDTLIGVQSKSQKQKYDFLKALMLDFAEGLSKNPAEAFAAKADVEDLKFWAELGAADVVIAKLQSIENNDIFTEAVKADLISKIQTFLSE